MWHFGGIWVCFEGLMRLFVICNFGYYWALLGQVLFLVLTIIVALLLGTFFVDNWPLIHSNQLVTLYKCRRHHSER